MSNNKFSPPVFRRGEGLPAEMAIQAGVVEYCRGVLYERPKISVVGSEVLLWENFNPLVNKDRT
jgi:hypothetical protein